MDFVRLNQELAFLYEYLQCHRERGFAVKCIKLVTDLKELILAEVPKPDPSILNNEIRALHLLSRTGSYIIEGYLPTSTDFVWCYDLGKFLYHAFGGKLFGHIAGLYEVLLMLRLMAIDQEIDKDTRPLFTDKGLPLKEISHYFREDSERKIGRLMNLTKSAMLQTRIKARLDFEKIQQVQKFFVNEWGYIWVTFAALPLIFKDIHQPSQKEILQVRGTFYNYGQLMKLIDDLVDLEESAEKESWNSLLIHTAHYLYTQLITYTHIKLSVLKKNFYQVMC